MGGWEEEEGRIYTHIFRGGSGAPPPLKIHFLGRLTPHPLLQIAPFLGAGGGVSRP